MELVHPSAKYKDSFLSAMAEEGTKNRAGNTDGLDYSAVDSDFNSFVKSLNDRALGIGLPAGYVPDSMLWLVEDDTYIGRASIRHRLNEHLTNIGGHIGYVIRPSMRRCGYGTKILELALVEARKLNLERVLLTCDEANIGSRKIIEKNGGVLEDRRANPDGGPDKLRFWIDLT